MPVAIWLGCERFGSFGRFGSLGRFGILGIIFLPQESASSKMDWDARAEPIPKLRAASRESSPVACHSLGEQQRGCLSEKFILQNEPIMSFRINKSNGFVLGLIGFVWLKKPLESQPRPLIGGCRWGRMEHRATGLCSLQGRQECLPYLNAYRYLFRNYRKNFVAPGICRGGRSSRRMFREPRGEASGG